MIRLIDTLSHGNRLSSASPLWKCGFAAAMIVLAYASHPAVQAAIALWMAAWTVVYARVPARIYLAMLGSGCLFFVASLPALAVDFRHGALALSESGLHTAARLFVRAACCLSAMLFLILTTPMLRLFQVLQKLRAPQLLLELMLVTYRFLFLLLDTARMMHTAQRARGGHGGFKSRIADTAALAARLFDRTMHRYRGLSHGLASRGFAGDIRLAPYEPAALPLRYRLEIALGGALLLGFEIMLRIGGYE
ncbi:cobalt ECF transporter T component CbiQ [Cohnella xylanilytica]|uniref:Cobalt ECF transporter T component CbiQ n=1 Tax=Cohnella xylanilytica TaxID=557555 RepID=A0A841UAH4_9BACL|nr:cobalt ECF transporter T component CbiQ [Cohnella xylanilytica]MBB6694930.1 cobalt ECF transporter T component CbiQ [Cohnella xylanilytica]